MEEQEHSLREGAIVDASIVAANRRPERDPEMRQTKRAASGTSG